MDKTSDVELVALESLIINQMEDNKINGHKKEKCCS